MTLLLDTNIWLWMLTEPDRLGDLREIIEDASTELLLSAASSWEISIKYAIGRLPLPEEPSAYLPARIRSTGVTPVPIEHTHTLQVAALPLHHTDPFDRLLVAQAQTLHVSLATADAQLTAYDVPILSPGPVSRR